MKVARLANLLILALALGVMSQLGSIQTAWKTSLLFGAGMGVPLLLRWLWHRQNAWGELVPIALSLVVAPILLWVLPGDEHDALRLISMTAIATVGSVAASLLTAAVPAERLDDFYTRMRPPGFWGPVARRCALDPADSRRVFWFGMAATFAAAGSVFALIVGGTWILSAPAPFGLSSGMWSAICLAVGVGLIPVWYRLSRVGEGAEEPA